MVYNNIDYLYCASENSEPGPYALSYSVTRAIGGAVLEFLVFGGPTQAQSVLKSTTIGNRGLKLCCLRGVQKSASYPARISVHARSLGIQFYVDRIFGFQAVLKHFKLKGARPTEPGPYQHPRWR